MWDETLSGIFSNWTYNNWEIEYSELELSWLW